MNNSQKNKPVISQKLKIDDPGEPSIKLPIVYQSPYSSLLILTFSIFVCEMVVMIILSSLPSFPAWSEAFFDSILLVFLLSPMLYFFLFRPLIQNINQGKQVEGELIMSRARLQHLLAVGPAVIYSSKPSGDYGATFISENIKEQMGFEPHEFIDNPEFWSKNIHPEDASHVFDELPQLFELNYHSHEYRFKHKDGNYKWMYDEMRLIRDNEGNPIEIVGYWIDITNRKQAEEALLESEERFRTAFENAATGIALMTNDGYFMKVNQTLCRILGYSEEELLDKTWVEITEPDDLNGCFGWLKRIKAGEESTYEKRFIHKLGNPVWVMMSTSLVFDSQGQIRYYISLFQDIMSRKEAEEQVKASLKEKEVLLREIHHRVKNNMQTIISLLRLQGDKIEDKKYADMFKEGEDRIRSMSLIHEQLYQTKDFANIDFGEYIKTLTNGLLTSSGVNTNKIRLNIEVKDVFFDIENAIPCGLIINELVSNSLKYAFPQGKEGEISITLQSTNEDEFELSVSDNGIGISENLDIEQTGTMGLQLVKVLAENQPDGKIDLDRTGGTQFRIKFKRTSNKPRI